MAERRSIYLWDDAWLDGVVEEVLEPDLPIVDPHHHLWEPREGMPAYLLDELHGDTGAGHHVEATVFVECAWGYRDDGPDHLRPVGETDAVAAVAEASVGRGAEIAGIVSFADLTHEAVGETLDAHDEAGRGRFRGIRHATAFDADPRIRRTHTRPTAGLMGEPAFASGVRAMADRGLSFDVWLYHPQIPELTALARAVPECRFVLDHLGGLLGVGPYEGRRDEILEQWRLDLAELAACPNVALKVGGIGMVVYGLGFENEDRPPTSDDLLAAWGEPMRFAIETFGPGRCMFESNFPVDKVSCSYVVLWNAFKKVSADLSATERASLFAGTARDVYRLDPRVGEGMADTCTHLDELADVAPSGDGCVECLQTGGHWVHLRRCASCGHVGCCDNSPNRHATAHFHETVHPLIQSFEPGEDWFWCYADDLFFELDGFEDSPSHP